MPSEKIFFEGNLVEGPTLSEKLVIEVPHGDDEDYYFSFSLEPVPGQDPRRVRVIMHRISATAGIQIEVGGEDDGVLPS